MRKYARGARVPVSRLIIQKNAPAVFFKYNHPCVKLSSVTSDFSQPLISIHLTLLYLKSKLVETSVCPKSIN